MELKNKLLSAYLIFKSRFFGVKIPLAIRWQLTNNCTCQCSYCNLRNVKSNELTTEQIFSIINELAEMGTLRISFSGGEPMLRKDIGQIINYCKKKGISTSMNSTGQLVKEKIGELKNLDLIKLSLDGSRETHDSIRGKGSYDIVIQAAETAKKNNLKFTFATTLTKFNIGEIDFLLKKSKEYKTVIAFQPLKKLYRGVEEINQISPNQKEFKLAIQKLIFEKKQGNKHIRNSLRGLNHIINWPKYEKLKCVAGELSCIISVEGKVMPCDRINYEQPLKICTITGFKKSFQQMPQVNCSGCGFCGQLELNYLRSLKFDILNDIKRFL